MSRLIALTVAVAAGAMCHSRAASLHRDTVDFFETREPVPDLFEPGAAQIPDALLRRLLGNLRGASAGENDVGYRVRDGKHLVNAHPTLVAVGAAGTSLGARAEDFKALRYVDVRKAFLDQRLLGNVARLLAVAAQAPCETLRDDQT